MLNLATTELWSVHALERQKERRVAFDAVGAALLWGREVRQWRGRTAWILDRRSVERALSKGEDVSRWEGTAVVEARDGTIITVLRCQHFKGPSR